MENNHENIDDNMEEFEVDNNKSDEQNKVNNEQIIKDNTIYKVKVIHSSATEYCYAGDDLKIRKNDYVIIPTKYGKDLGKILGIVTNLLEIGSGEIVKIDRIAEDEDLNQ